MNINDINSLDSNSSLNSLESEEHYNFINTNKNNAHGEIDINYNDKETQIIIDNQKQNIREELLKQKAYYKILLSDYKKFLKKINYQSSNTDLSYDATTINTTSITGKKTIDKSKNYNMKDTYKNLYKNIKKIKKDLYFIFENFNENMLVLDGENILKSYKYQQLIKFHLTKDQFNKYFEYWYNGNDNGLIQPMTSLNLSINDKIFLIDLLVKNYLNLFNCVIILSGKIIIDFDSSSSFINQKKSFIIPVIYDKEDIREQDDHLLLYIYYHFSKIKKCEIISGDKFKWFNHSANYLKNFRLEYNFDENKINIDITNAYTNDIIIYNKHKYQSGYYYVPFIKNIFLMQDKTFIKFTGDILTDNVILEKYETQIVDFINEKDYESIINFITSIYLILIDLNVNYENNILLIKKYSDLIIFFISNIIHLCKINFEEITFILNRLSSMNKKVFDKIEKYDIYTLYKIIFESNDDLSNLSSLTVDSYFSDDYFVDKNTNMDIMNSSSIVNFTSNIENYISMTEIYLILKSISFLLNNNKSIIKIAKLFSCIMKIYDKIDISIYKIRKISNNFTFFNKLFLSILSHHIFMKKNGFCKKDY